MKLKTIYLATDNSSIDEEFSQAAFEDSQDCIDFCNKRNEEHHDEDWGWHEVKYFYYS